MRKKLILFVLLLCSIASTHAQRTVKGTILGENEPLIGASVLHLSSNTGTTSDFEGNFELSNLPEGTIEVQISYIGFMSQQIKLDPSTTFLNVELEKDPYQLEDVIVTANKKAQSIQKIPMAITALSPVTLRRSGAKQFRDFASGIPNLAFGTQGSDGGGRYSNEISIRGISGINTTAMYLDETPLPESITPNLIDVSRVEVLKGPQGTLYGSATMAGAVRVLTNSPNTQQVEGSVGISAATVQEGDFNYGLQGVYNQPITDKIALRASAYYDMETGVYDRVVNTDVEIVNSQNPLTEDFYGDPIDVMTDGCAKCSTENKENIDDKRNYGINASLGFYPNDKISIVPKIIHQREEGDGYDFAENSVDNFIQNSNTGIDETFSDKWTHYSLGMEFEFPQGKLVSSTSFLDRIYSEVEDVTDINTVWWMEYEDENIDSGDAIWADDVVRSVGTKLFQQELRYESNYDGKFNFLAGAFYRSEEQDWLYLDERPGMASYLLSDNAFDEAECPDCDWDYDHVQANLDAPWYLYSGLFEDTEIALFGQFYYNITQRLKATLGFRLFSAKQSKNITENGADFGFMPLSLNDDNTESSFNPKFNLSYQFNPNQLAYATVVRGFRLGDINENLPSFCLEELGEGEQTFPRFFTSDYIWNYELGFKSIWSDGRLVTNAAIFYNQWGDLQQYRFLDCGWGYTSNVGAATTSGLELDLRYKLNNQFELSGGLGLLNPVISEGSEFLEAEPDDRILYSPKFTANAAFSYFKELKNNISIYANANFQHVGERLGTYNPEEDADNVYPAYSLMNARVGMQFSSFDVALFANNLTNQQANFGAIQSFAGNLPGRNRFATNRPRTIGLDARFYF